MSACSMQTNTTALRDLGFSSAARISRGKGKVLVAAITEESGGNKIGTQDRWEAGLR